MRDLVRAEVAAAREEIVGLCSDLVGMVSIAPPGDTRGVAGVITSFLERHHIVPDVIAADPGMPNVVASITGSGPGAHVVMNVHMDTMEPGDESLWTVPVFELTRRDGRLFGLGIGNMKGAVAAMATAFTCLARHRSAWCGTVTFTAVSDEVTFGPQGAAHLLAALPELGAADALLCGEGPGFMNVAVAEKGVLWLTLEARARGGHSSAVRRGASAVTALAAVVAAVDELNGRVVNLPAELEGVFPGQDAAGRLLTANVGTFHGGTLVNQIAVAARAEIDVRLPPGITIADVEALIDIEARRHGVEWQRTKGWEANWTQSSDPLVRAVLDAATWVRGERPDAVVRLPASDASRWRALGIPAVCYGPQPTYSAGVDDYVEEQDVLDCAAVYALAALTITGGVAC